MPFTEGDPRLAENRRKASKLFCRLFPAEIHDNYQSLVAAGNLINDGYGVLVVGNHFSYRDGPAAFAYVAARSDGMVDRPWLAPVARHISDVAEFLNRLTGTKIDIKPIYTTSTVTRQEFAHHHTGEGLPAYRTGAINTLKKGGIVALFPQGTRMPYLGKPGEHHKAMELILNRTTRDGVNNFAILPVGLSVEGADDYRLYSGLNLGLPYTVNIGPLWLKDAVLANAHWSKQTLDAWAFEQLRGLLPPEYPRIPPSGVIYSAGT